MSDTVRRPSLWLASMLVAAACSSPQAVPDAESLGSEPVSTTTSTAGEEPASTTEADAASTSIDEDLLCIPAELPAVLDQAFEVGAARRLSVAYHVDTTTPESSDVQQTVRLGSVAEVDLIVVDEREDGWVLRYVEHVGEQIRNYAARLPDGASDRIPGDETIAIEYVLRDDGRIELLTDRDQITELYASLLQRLELERVDPAAASIDVLATSVGLLVLDPSTAPDKIGQILAVYHHGHGRTVSFGDSMARVEWPLPFGLTAQESDAASTVESLRRYGCLLLTDESAEDLPGIGPLGVWTGKVENLRDVERGIVYRSTLWIRGTLGTGERIVNGIAVGDSEWQL